MSRSLGEILTWSTSISLMLLIGAFVQSCAETPVKQDQLYPVMLSWTTPNFEDDTPIPSPLAIRYRLTYDGQQKVVSGINTVTLYLKPGQHQFQIEATFESQTSPSSNVVAKAVP